jgi:excisionase family DNA binding protein
MKPSPLMAEEAPRLAYSVQEIAKSWGVSRGLIEGLIKSGKLCSFKAGDRRLISKQARDEFMRQETSGEQS